MSAVGDHAALAARCAFRDRDGQSRPATRLAAAAAAGGRGPALRLRRVQAAAWGVLLIASLASAIPMERLGAVEEAKRKLLRLEGVMNFMSPLENAELQDPSQEMPEEGFTPTMDGEIAPTSAPPHLAGSSPPAPAQPPPPPVPRDSADTDRAMYQQNRQDPPRSSRSAHSFPSYGSSSEPLNDRNFTDPHGANQSASKQPGNLTGTENISMVPAVGPLHTITCHEFMHAKTLAPDQACPKECPFYAETADSAHVCVFKCVLDNECGATELGVRADTKIADPTLKHCRNCDIPGCKQCSVKQDKCNVCKDGFSLLSGTCLLTPRGLEWALVVVFMCVGVFGLCWYIELNCRPVVNEEGLKRGLVTRSLSKLRQTRNPDDANGGRETRSLFPLNTNMADGRAGGSGTTLFFRFQIFWILWAFSGLVFWAVVIATTDNNLLTLGMKDVKTPRALCSVIAWGVALQDETMHVLVKFAACLYVWTVLGTFAFAVLQRYKYHEIDDAASMKDFMAMLAGVPLLNGTEPVETELATLLREQTGCNVIGVSVAWDLTTCYSEVMDCIESESGQLADNADEDHDGAGSAGDTGGSAHGSEDEGHRQRHHHHQHQHHHHRARHHQSSASRQHLLRPPTRSGPMSPMEINGWRWKIFGLVDRTALNLFFGVPEDARLLSNPEELVKGMKTTGHAYVVFATEAEREIAIERLAETQLRYRHGRMKLVRVVAEPESVIWRNLGLSDGTRIRKQLWGILMLLTSLMCWVFFVYLPYMRAVARMDFDSGNQEPGGLVAYLCTALVVGGNILLYALCAIVAEKSGFKYQEEREAGYMIFYVVALLGCVSLDACVASWISWSAMVRSRAHLPDGRALESLTDLKEIFDSFPVQKALGFQLWVYCFPATFLLGYLAEPIALVYMPYHIMTRVVRSNPFIVGWRADLALTIFAPFDMGRYADVLVSVMLASLVFLVPAGYIAYIFTALLFSNMYIYFWDHYRVLRAVPGFCFSLNVVDNFAVNFMVIPCAIMVTSVVYRANCMQRGHYCFQGSSKALYLMCLGVFLLHCFLHVTALTVIVPRLCRITPRPTDKSYAEVARVTPATWFNVNPSWVLRSEFFYRHSPPAQFFWRGREHLLKANPAIGQFFEDKKALPEKYW